MNLVFIVMNHTPLSDLSNKTEILLLFNYTLYIINHIQFKQIYLCEINRGVANLSNMGGDFVKNVNSYEKFADYIILFSTQQ